MALDISAANSSVNFGNISSLNGAAALSISGWFRYVGAPTNGRAAWGRRSSNAGFWSRVLNSAGNLGADIVFNTGITAAIPAGELTVDTWHHYAILYDGTQSGNAARLRWWLDGAPVTVSFAGTVPAVLASAGSQPWLFAKASTAESVSTAAYFGAWKMWLAALSEEEILNERWTAAPRRTANLLRWWLCTETAVKDYAQVGAAATTTGTVALTTVDPPATYGAGVM
jgi:hypothetical protein